ncbi:MAG TPA: hypothetical protein EYN46_03850, partial [Candidatus Poseidoniales archaeon]|nr:hypothetical protein [Candidatus Poseidoniales archaeon]
MSLKNGKREVMNGIALLAITAAVIMMVSVTGGGISELSRSNTIGQDSEGNAADESASMDGMDKSAMDGMDKSAMD